MKQYCWWYRENAIDADWTEPHAAELRTQPVGQKRPHSWGLYDMIGNVWEWCADVWASDYYAQSPPNDPGGPLSGSGRVLRGGGWNAHARYCRSALRLSVSPAYWFYDLGFRLASVLAEE